MLELSAKASTVRGFTLIELLVTVALAAVLMMVAVPSFTSFTRNSQLTSFTNTLLAGINAARGEAMKRGMYAMVVPANGTSWDSGWIVFIDADRSQAYEAANDIRILTSDAKPTYLTITGNGTATGTTPYVMYDASGYSRTKTGGFGALTFEVKRNDLTSSDQVRRLKIASSGRARICTPQSSTDATCSSAAGSL